MIKFSRFIKAGMAAVDWHGPRRRVKPLSARRRTNSFPKQAGLFDTALRVILEDGKAPFGSEPAPAARV